ncbi:hypothetical protein EIQ06_15905 [Xanthomonas campestris pv. campestris]|jgi:hypothetical protein|uniref:Secreted protein n=1 Tax=Xanthomonas campestris pv. campestris (strain B100) TaxID=509169 RepID=B0RXB9_XANCB|nr:hypothetical protein [Xanthomonas campestris]MCD0249217.1 hypothetical protein [Xanthomonas campestris pv. campestris]MCD0260670.1 hypothetical protein [Xanthomonas campestris pv. campestris]MCD0268966.1 hypothetical protein [Xanthomonas campestris pv. campestris]MCD0276710.1 hypothetical protein [Xanthomonas campestris pv. campestris]MCF8787178.1 hypothetical protein [Xanthomonas campestris pv. campestris]
MLTNRLGWISGCGLALALSACGSEAAPEKEDAVKAVERFYTEQGRQATSQRTWRFEVKDASGLEIDCTKLPNGDQDCRVSGNIQGLGSIGGQPTTPKTKEMRLKMTMKFRPASEGWELVDATDNGTSAG